MVMTPTKVAILGAGGNMGRRITRSLREFPQYQLHLVEPSERGRELIREAGLDVMEEAPGLHGAEMVVFAVPDRLVPGIAEGVIPKLAADVDVLFLDPAALAADRIVRRDDINCFVTHPTHPPLYSLLAEDSAAARKDFWGGGLAHQSIVFARCWGKEDHAERVQQLAIDMFAPISRAHRITVQQMAMLEPALSETLINGCVAVIKDGMDHVVKAGLPPEAVWDFGMGHFQIGIALIFEQLNWRMSEGAQLALQQSRKHLFRDDWETIFDEAAILASVKEITGGE